jgi:hypothetical protein
MRRWFLILLALPGSALAWETTTTTTLIGLCPMRCPDPPAVNLTLEPLARCVRCRTRLHGARKGQTRCKQCDVHVTLHEGG